MKMEIIKFCQTVCKSGEYVDKLFRDTIAYPEISHAFLSQTEGTVSHKAMLSEIEVCYKFRIPWLVVG